MKYDELENNVVSVTDADTMDLETARQLLHQMVKEVYAQSWLHINTRLAFSAMRRYMHSITMCQDSWRLRGPVWRPHGQTLLYWWLAWWGEENRSASRLGGLGIGIGLRWDVWSLMVEGRGKKEENLWIAFFSSFSLYFTKKFLYLQAIWSKQLIHTNWRVWKNLLTRFFHK